MTDALDDLTDKEKEALRLLLAGHDAKSSAAELDISVHTVNDRLRNARRKIGVSSSREAARILGDAEGGAPQNPAHRPFGIPADDGSSDNADLTSTRPAAVSRTAWLAGGMLIMSIVIAAAVVAFIGSPAEPAPEAAPETELVAQVSADDAASVDRAEIFLARIDAGDWAGSWEAAGPFFQSQASEEEWAEVVAPVRSPLGSVEDRQMLTIQRVETLPGAPEGDYAVLQFQTDFSDSPGENVETVIMLQGDAGWEVVGYFIR